jgi:signal transduction histidine kinase/DNA-binding response OmpR family regulator
MNSDFNYPETPSPATEHPPDAPADPHAATERSITCGEDIVRSADSEAEFREGKDAAEAASHAKSEFLADMTREIRAPISSILGMSELALNTDLNLDQREYLNVIKGAADSLLNLITDVLDFATIETKKLALETMPFNLRGNIADTLKSLAPRAQQKGLELACHICSQAPAIVVGDPGRLRQILENLAGNAIKFTETGEVVLDVACESETPRDAMLRFSVSDTGVGIPPQTQQLIRATLTRSAGPLRWRPGGTGLGLTICAHLVEMMGGRTWFQSEVGRGSTFYFAVRFTLPQEQPAGPPAWGPASLKGLRVLVVDDNATNRWILEEMVSEWGLRATAVEGGQQALAAIEQARLDHQPYALVLVDGYMPEMDGFMLAERINRNPQMGGPTIMMLASAGRRGDAARCRELGVNAYLTKPIQHHELMQAILSVRDVGGLNSGALVTRHSLRDSRQRLSVLLLAPPGESRDAITRALEKHGHRVLNLPVDDADKVCEVAGFDLAIIDMTSERAAKTAAAIHGKLRGNANPVSIIGIGSAREWPGGEAAAIHTWISHPVDVRILLEAVEAHMNKMENSGSATLLEISNPTAIDRASMLARVEGDTELLLEMAALFLEDCPKQMLAIREAVISHDGPAMERAAHTLKGAVGNFVTQGAFDTALQLEMLARKGDLSRAEETYLALQAHIEQVSAELETITRELGN